MSRYWKGLMFATAISVALYAINESGVLGHIDVTLGVAFCALWTAFEAKFQGDK